MSRERPDRAGYTPRKRQSHLDRLRAGRMESVETSEIHLDVLTNLKRINSHVTSVIYPIIEQ